MQVYNIEDMKGGWFVGSFHPTVYVAPFEVCYKYHKKGEVWDTHFHKRATEINLLVRGKMTINDVQINEGQIFVIEPYYVSEPVFLEDCELVVIKTISDEKDKYIV
jgi:mannose-6-phosphate isomerase-like protein (cupin superfamily)